MEFKLLTALKEKETDAVHAILLEHNLRSSSAFFAAREQPENAPSNLYVLARDSGEKIVGGLMGETQFAWLKISILAVVEDHRRRGIGRELVAHAEAEALIRGCRHSLVDTMDYQGPEFYQRLGYKVAGKIDNWDSHGHAKYFLTRNLHSAQ